ncbi:MAG: mechanosensitive ion channel [Lachnospiraceae bacterium]
MVLRAETTVAEEAAAAAVETAGDAAQEMGRFTAYIQDHIPDLIQFGVKVLLAFVFFWIGRVVIKWIRKIVRRSIEHSHADKGVEQFVDSLLKFLLYFLLIFSIATKFGVDTASVAALIASGGVAAGLALQGSLSNFAGGVLILLLKPFEVGDYIVEDTNHNEGTVKEIQIFYTKLSTIDNKTIVIPNGILTNSSLTNMTTQPERRLNIKIGITYEADLKKAKRIMEKLLREDACVMKDKEIAVFVDDLADHAVVIGARGWVKNEEFWPTQWRLLEEIKLSFDDEGIEIAYPQMKVHMAKEE